MEDDKLRELMNQVTTINRQEKKQKQHVKGARPCGAGLKYNDFLPAIGYHTEDLIEDANRYLAENRTRVPFSCEFLTILNNGSAEGNKNPSSYIDTESSCYVEKAKKSQNYCRVLRLWTLPCDSNERIGAADTSSSKVDCVTIIPKIINQSKKSSEPIYETLSETVNNLQSHRINGKILNAQTDMVLLQEGVTRIGMVVDPKQTFWSEGKNDNHFLTVLRVFTIATPEALGESLICKDFKGQSTGSDITLCYRGASDWAEEQGAIGWKLLNFQTVDIRANSNTNMEPSGINSDKTYSLRTKHLCPVHKILRVFLKKTDTRYDSHFAVENFHPDVRVLADPPEYVGQGQNFRKASFFLNQASPSLISIETVSYNLIKEKESDFTETFQDTQGSELRKIFLFRLYLEKNYTPIDVLPNLTCDDKVMRSRMCQIL